MPWKMVNNEKVYEVSEYSKDDLPTWSELYEFYQKGFYLDGIEDNDIEPYWKISRRKYLTALACNQFNKELYEDAKLDDIKKNLNMNSLVDIRFICIDDERIDSDWYSDHNPPILTLQNPAGHTNPFILGTSRRININKLGNIRIGCLSKFKSENKPIEVNRQDLELIMNQLIMPVVNYFEHLEKK